MMSMREHMSAQMMRGGLHDGKMQHSYGAGMMMNLGGRMLKSQQGDSFAFQDSLMGVGTRLCVCIYTYYIIYMNHSLIYIYIQAGMGVCRTWQHSRRVCHSLLCTAAATAQGV